MAISTSSTMQNSKIGIITNFQDISDHFKSLNQRYCTNIKSLVDNLELSCKNQMMDLKEEKKESLLKDVTYHKQLYLLSTSRLNVVPKRDYEEKLNGCRLCQIPKSRSPIYKCSECKNFYYCQKCFFLCIDKHPHMFLPADLSQQMRNIMEESNALLQRRPAVNSKYNAKVMNMKDLMFKIPYGSSKEFVIKIKFKNTGKDKWKKGTIFIDYPKDSEIRKFKECINQECDPGKEIEVNATIPEMDKVFPGLYTVKLGLLLPNRQDSFFGELALVKIMVGLDNLN